MILQCVDCGTDVEWPGRGARTKRCDGCNRERLRKRAQERYLPYRKTPAGQPYIPPRAKWLGKAKQMRAAGSSFGEIAKVVGVSSQRVSKALPGKIANLRRKPCTFYPCIQCGQGRVRKFGGKCHKCRPAKKHPVDKAVQAAYRRKLQARGICTRCHKPRGKDGTVWSCRKCADEVTESNKQRYHERFPESGTYKVIDGKRVRVKLD